MLRDERRRSIVDDLSVLLNLPLAARCDFMKAIHFETLPGCVPYRNERLMRVRQTQTGLPLIEFLCEFHPPTPRQSWLDWIGRGEITISGRNIGADALVTAGERYLHVMPDYVEPEVNAAISILHEDDALLVIDKPAPLPVHPSGRFNRNTLSKLLESVYPNESLRIAHRLDANTTGVVVFCRTAAAAAKVQPQFERRQVAKQYLARVQGHAPWQVYRCDLEIGDAKSFGGNDTAGARVTHRSGQPAETLFHCLDRFDDGTSLLRVSPITGRTNQIRVHAAAIGFPIVGDPFYAPPFDAAPPGVVSTRPRLTQTLGVDDPPMCLHAWQIRLIHPVTDHPITLESTPPAWAEQHHAR